MNLKDLKASTKFIEEFANGGWNLLLVHGFNFVPGGIAGSSVSSSSDSAGNDVFMGVQLRDVEK